MNKIPKTKRNSRKIYLIALLAILIGLAAYFMLRPESGLEIPTQSEAMDIPFRKQGELQFIGQQNKDTLAVIDIEVADTDQLRARGLMYRRSLPDNAGMLFIQNREEIQSFWMKNTYIPLDIIFVDRDMKIVTIQANTTPMKEWSYASTEPALYVVEVNAGFANQHGIRIGDAIVFSISQ